MANRGVCRGSRCPKVLRTTSMNQKFPYILRISEKAKHVRFQVSAEKGLVIIVPNRFSASRVLVNPQG